MNAERALLGGRSEAAFLKEFWQKRPCLIRGAFPGWKDPLTPDELAGLALEPDVTSRLVRHTEAPPHWSVRHGPFTEGDFAALPETDWTLLVQEVNHHVPEAAALLAPFRFLPAWRLDDVMVSYAAPGGSVGPHIDSYDVFLIQGRGRRRWQVGVADAPADLVPGLDLQVLASFTPVEEWVLEPGDMLYLPPGIPHHGVAEGGPCMTCSVGFRAPGRREVLARFFEEAVGRADPEARYADPDLTPRSDDPGRITAGDLARLRTILRDAVADDGALDRFFGRLLTEPRRYTETPGPEAPVPWRAIRSHLERGGTLGRHGGSRWAYISEADAGATLFVDGKAFPLPADTAALAPLLCGGTPLSGTALSPYFGQPQARDLLTELLLQGVLYPEAEG